MPTFYFALLSGSLRILLSLLLTGATLLGHLVSADPREENVRIEESYHLRSNTVYQFSSIVVEKTGILRIDPGAVVKLSAGAHITVYGKLIALGTAESPISIESATSLPWGQLQVAAQAPNPELAYVRFQHFSAPIRLGRVPSELRHLEFINGQPTTLELGAEGQIHYPSITLQDLVFIVSATAPINSQSQQMGLVLYGGYEKMRIDDLWITHLADEPPEAFRGVQINGSVASLSYQNWHLPHGCNELSREVTGAGVVEIKSKTPLCARGDKLFPVIFVPGYATSVNLHQLAQPLSAPAERTGWGFIKYFNGSYEYMLEALRKSGLQVEVAFYDWRLPAQQSVEAYLLPLINEVKHRYGVDRVTLLAHSFGGLVARAYIQGPTYKRDVEQLIQLGTPNNGTAKVYDLVEAGELPVDWQLGENLIRYYRYAHKKTHYTNRQITSSYFPSARQLMPIYPSVQRGHKMVPADQLHYKNNFLLDLNSSLERLEQGTSLRIVGSDSQPTLEHLVVDEVARSTSANWIDGKPLSEQPEQEKVGDGTVAWQSLILARYEPVRIVSTHMNLPVDALPQIKEWIFPHRPLVLPNIAMPVPRQASDMLSFFFDCPVEVTITLPGGRLVSSTLGGSDQIGEVFTSSEMIWFMFPKQEGEYKITIKALEETPVRWWVNSEGINSLTLAKDQQVEAMYASTFSPPVLLPDSRNDTSGETKESKQEVSEEYSSSFNPLPLPSLYQPPNFRDSLLQFAELSFTSSSFYPLKYHKTVTSLDPLKIGSFPKKEVSGTKRAINSWAALGSVLSLAWLFLRRRGG